MASGVKCGPHGGKNSKMKSVDGFLVELQKEKVYITPSPMGGGLHNPPTYETIYITP
jgi:hypothetical protein